MFNQSYI